MNKPLPFPTKPNDPLPWVSINMAITADGKIASSNRRVSSFGSDRDHAFLYELRSLADAVMCGARTVNTANVELDSGGVRYQKKRLQRGLARENLRVVVSGSARLDLRGRLFQKAGGKIIVLTTERAPKSRVSALEDCGLLVHRSGKSEVDLTAALRWLRREQNVSRLHCEGGGELNGALFLAGLVDVVYLTLCPLVFGGRLSPTIADGQAAASLAESFAMRLDTVKQVGSELFLKYRRATSA